MKVTPKFQNGGGFDSFFTTYTPVQVQAPRQAPQESSRSRQSSGDSEKGKLTEKDFFDMLKNIDGLPNEMSAIVTDLMNTFQLSNLTGVDPGNLATTYLQNLYQVKIAAQNKKKYDDALSAAGKNGSLAEPAISMDGKIVVQNSEGQIDTISLDTYLKNDGQYQPLTVSNLARMRAYTPQLANNQSIFDIINNSMGFESFQELVSKAKQALGSSEVTRNGYFTNEGQASKGLALLNTLKAEDKVQAYGSVTAQGLYEYKIIDKTQKGQIDALTDYIVATFPDRAKTWAALKLGRSDKNQATRDLVLRYLLSGATENHSFDIQYKGSLDKVEGRIKDNDGGSSGAKETYLTSLQNGLAARKEQRTLLPGNQGAFKVTGSVYGSFLDQDGNTLSDVTLQELLSKTGLAGISNSKSITFGDNVLSSNSLSRIAVENTGGFRAVLPSIKRGTTITPNFELIEKFDDIVQEVNAELGNNAKYEERESLLERKMQSVPELQELLDMTGKLDPGKFSVFFIVDGLASDLNFSFITRNNDGSTSSISDKSNPYIVETNNEEDKKYFMEVTKPEDFDEYNPINMFDWFSNYDHIYKSSVFIPIQTNNRLAAIIFSGQKIGEEAALGIEGEYQRSQISNKVGNAVMYDSNWLFK